MSRPTTRGKGKRQRQGENENDPTEILRKINASGEVSSDDVNKLYMIWKPACQGCRVNTKDNPNCFCGLVPPPNGARKSGLWQKMSEIIQALGPAPSPEPRASDDWPAGLSNLGATCYANSILQFLYMNRSFRDGVFSVEPDVLKQKPVLDQLARLFVQLYACKMSFVDSAPFIKTLELDNGVQQDSHEFMTLLLSLLERCLSHSRVSKARTIVQDLFRGSVSHATTCSNCGKDSEASSKIEDFYELELNVKGLKTLDLSLDDYLTVEKLDGENQYFCDSCQQRVDATRCIKLRSLPNILNFQLKRCVFLPKTTAKKKITTAFAFPRQLDMRGRLSEAPQSGWTYDLSAILLHKGTAVNSGHYVAHIKDENSGIWWEFDDEVVTKLGCHPFGEGSSSAGNEGSQSEAGPNASGLAGTRASTNGNHKDSWYTQVSESSNKMFSSSDAYMLMYTRRLTGKDENERLTGDNVSHVNLGCQNSSSHDDYCLPSHLSKDIEVMNAAYLDASKEYELKKEKVAQDIKERRQEVRSILSEAIVQPNEQSFFWVSTDWLRQWSDSITPPSTLDNTQIQCMHGKVPASRIGSMKRVSAEAWVKLLSKYDGGPTLSNNDHCMACLIDVARSIVNADSYRDRRMAMKDLASLVLSGKCPDGEYYVSRTWLQQWVRRKNLDAPNESDAGPTDSLRCPHGQLLPEKSPGAKRLLVPVNLWCFFYGDAMSVKPDDILGCKSFSADSDQCAQCSNELSEVATWEDSLRELKLKQRQNHEKLSTGKTIPLSLQCKYFLVPTSWVTSWRNFVNASGKNVSSVMEPESLDAIIDSLKCEKHLQLAERPPDLVWKRGMLLQKGLTTDSLTIIPENDWDGFCKEWGGDKESGISATIESINSSECILEGTSPEFPQNVEHLDPQGEVANGADTAQVLLRTTPEICEECIGERESQELMEKLNYCDQDISVTLLRGKEAPKSILDAPPTASEPDRRTSKRSRKSRDGNTVSLKVSGSTTIYHLKMMIWESLGVVKENQILRKGSRIVDQELATLADSSIFPGDRLWVQDSEIHEHRDIADELSDQKVDALRAEEGFRGTLLTAEASSQSV